MKLFSYFTFLAACILVLNLIIANGNVTPDQLWYFVGVYLVGYIQAWVINTVYVNKQVSSPENNHEKN